MKQFEEVLTSCIVEIRSGKATIEECLARHQEMRQELEPLLRTAASIKSPPAYQLKAGYKQSARADLLRQIRQVKQPKRVSFADIISLGIPRQLAGIRAIAAALVVVLAISMAGGGTAYASRNSIPGDILYPVKTNTENVRLFLAGDSIAKAELNVEFAGKRLQELQLVVNRSKENSQAAVDRYEKQLAAATRQLEESTLSTESTSRLESIITAMQFQISTCDELLDTNPGNITQIDAAATQAIDCQLKALQKMSQLNIVKATEMNNGMMQNRMQRAAAAAASGRYQIMAQRLSQYRQLNQLSQQLLEWAQNTNNQVETIKSICMQQLALDTETLMNLSQQVPGEYQGTINECEQMIHQFQQRFRYGQDGTGNQGSGPGGVSGSYPGSATTGTGSPGTTQSPNIAGDPANITTAPTTNPGGGSGDNSESGNMGGTGNGGEAGGSISDNGTSGKRR